MNIYVDESGLFVIAKERGSWSVVAAFATPDRAVPHLESVIFAAKQRVERSASSEIKLKHFQNNELAYFAFLDDVAQLDGILLAVASDSSMNPLSDVIRHQQSQASSILRHVDKMRHDGGRKGVQLLASEVYHLSPQLYIQNCCQITLMYEFVARAINYFAQRDPETLGDFKWRIDQKDTSPNSFQAAFEKLSPVLLQTMSLTSPLARIRSPDFEYKYLERFEIPIPAYLKDDYGVEIAEKSALDIQRIIREDIEFVDSAKCVGVQIVDLIVSGLRRCLRHGFADNDGAAARLGRLMIQAPRNRAPVNLILFGKPLFLDKGTSKLLHIMRANAKRMFVR